MIEFLTILRSRDEPLFYFGVICLLGAVFTLGAACTIPLQVKGTNAWYKPFKFALSIGIFSWTMGWFTWYLGLPVQVMWYNRATIILLGFEVVYITLQASRGQLSHFNVSSPLYAALTGLMAFAAIGSTLYTAYIGVLFFKYDLPALPDYYLWSIRIGILLFVVFAFEGGIMGANGAHTIGGPDGSEGLPVLNWSRKFGDARIAHFAGMHALQGLPLLAFYLIKNKTAVFIIAGLYALLVLWVLIQALNGKPFMSPKRTQALSSRQ